MRCRKLLYHLACRLAVSHKLIYFHLRQRQIITHSVNLFYAVYHVKHAWIVLSLLKQLKQYLHCVCAVLVSVTQTGIGIYGLIVVARADIELGKLLLINLIVWRQVYGTLQ